MIQKKKLIEVALPLEAINLASAREKSIRHGHPSTFHLWWARRPLAAARAVIFAQMVDDPSAHPDIFKTTKAQEKERLRLFRIIESLVKWENTSNKEVLQQAQDEIWQSWRYTCAENADHPRAAELFDRYKLPAFHDPFAGGGTLPLEAQRLGLQSYASDLNPVAVLINKAMIEIPAKFAGNPPINSNWQAKTPSEKALTQWHGAAGLAEDIRYYGQWMRDEAENRIGRLYPKAIITETLVSERDDLRQYLGQTLPVVAWLWARTVKSPNPAYAHVDVPIVSTFLLCTKVGKEAYIEPLVLGDRYTLEVRKGKSNDAEAAARGTRLGKAQDFFCLVSGVPIQRQYVRDEAKAGRMGTKLMSVIVQGPRGRVYLPATTLDEDIARSAAAYPIVEEARSTFLSGLTPTRAMITGGVCSAYGLRTHGDLFTPRQLVALTTLSDLVALARLRVKSDAGALSHITEGNALAYADAVAVYLALGVSRQTNRSATLNFWDSAGENVQQVFGRQAFAMTWDFVESNPFSDTSGNFTGQFEYMTRVIEATLPAQPAGAASQCAAQTQDLSSDKVISTDPPYFDNINYADLSDFFYVWLRRALRSQFPDLFATVAVPKADELVAIAYRHGGKPQAEAFFLGGMTNAMQHLSALAHPAFPVTIYYAFKQSETKSDGTASTGWETFLDAVVRSGFAITGTWPMRTELTGNLKKNIGALASSIILVCRRRAVDAITTTRREFVTALKADLPLALAHLQRGNIAPVDLAQAAIGPGMAVYTRYAKVLDADGKPMLMREALSLINQTLDEALAEQEGDFDPDSRWALTWFEQSGFAEGEYGLAEQLSKSKNTSIAGMVEARILESKRGKVRLLKPSELPAVWEPASDHRLTAWETVHHLIRTLESSGEGGAATLVAKLGGSAEIARELCYRLYMLCERKKRTVEALSYNGLVKSWPEITRLAGTASSPQDKPSTNDMFAKE